MVTQSTTFRTNPDVAYDADPEHRLPGLRLLQQSGLVALGPVGRDQRRGPAVGGPDRHRRPGTRFGRQGLRWTAPRRHCPCFTPCPPAISTTSPAARAPAAPGIRPGRATTSSPAAAALTPTWWSRPGGDVDFDARHGHAFQHHATPASDTAGTSFSITVTALDSVEQRGHRLHRARSISPVPTAGRRRWVLAGRLHVHRRRQRRPHLHRDAGHGRQPDHHRRRQGECSMLGSATVLSFRQRPTTWSSPSSRPACARRRRSVRPSR